MSGSDPVITEFMADNERGIVDFQGERHDWIEVYNPGPAVNLAGWRLTDNANQPSKWVFPSVMLGTGQYMVVFASGKNYTTPELHTNFKLEKSGEYLALIRPDGMITSAYAPTYPPQLSDVSYGLGPGTTENLTVIAPGHEGRVWVPLDSSLDATWMNTAFSDLNWYNAWTGIGYMIGQPALPAEVEPNDQISVASDARYNFGPYSGNLYHMGFSGTISTNADEDWINIGVLDAGEIISVTLSGIASGRGTLVDPDIELYRANTTNRMHSSNNGGVGGVDSLMRRYSVEVTDTYFLRVRSWNHATSGTYQVGIWLENQGTPPITGGPYLVETESNNNKATANNASSSWRAPGYLSRTSGIIATAGDLDTYRFHFTAGDLVTIYADSTSSLDARVWLLDAAGNILGLEDGRSQFQAPYNLDSPIFGYIIPTTGTYYVRVGSTTAGPTGAYNLDVYLSTTTAPPASTGTDPYGGLFTTNLAGLMYGKSSSAYLRLPFALGNPTEFNTLTLKMKYDDGFAAYLNGVLVATRNAPATLAHNSTALAPRPGAEAVVYETIDLSAHVHLLQTQNVLAIHALNASASDPDLLIIPELTASSITFGAPQYFTTPTPGAANMPGALGRVEDTKFSVNRGFYDEPFDLMISTATSGATIRYTLDGSVPTLSHGFTYASPIRISTTATVRAAAFRAGFIPTNVDTHTYLFLNDVLHQPNNPAGFPSFWASGAPAADYEMDPEIVFNLNAPAAAMMNGIYYFSGYDYEGGQELWRSDGTAAGTWRVKDIYPGIASSSPRNLVAVGNAVFFVANNHANGWELWMSDGSDAGTQLVRDIYPGQYGSSPENLTAMNGVLYFTALEPSAGRELWRSDGTTAGTWRISDINAGSASSNPSSLTVMNGMLYFAATTSTTGTELWKSGGTAQTTAIVRDIHSSGNSNPVILGAHGGYIHFMADDGSTGRELWRSDGDLWGTMRLADLSGGSSTIEAVAELNGEIYFFANGQHLYRLSGTTVLPVTSVSPATPAPTALTSFNGSLYFFAAGDQLWKSDGTAAGTSMVIDINAATYAGANPRWLLPADGVMYFAAATAGQGYELWRTDGTAAGTFVVRDIYPGPEGSTPVSIVAHGGSATFIATDQTAGFQVWRTNGSTAGTAMIKDIQPGSPASIASNDLRSIPTLSIVMSVDDWFKNSNSPSGTGGIYSFPTQQDSSGTLVQVWERAASVELIDGDGSTMFQIDAGVQIQGGASRQPGNSPKHSLRLLFKSIYGPGKLNFDWFGGDATDSFDTIVLKAGYNNAWFHHNEIDTYGAPAILSGQRERAQYIHDQWASNTQLDMGHASKHGTYVHLYINGLYWGLYSPMERPEESWAASYFGGDKEDYDVLNNTETLISGNKTAWDTMFNIANRPTSDPRWIGTAEGYSDIQQYLDIEAFIDYMLLNFYGDNRDWASHNWYVVRRSRVDGQAVNTDGFKFISWDAERILELPNGNSVIGQNLAKRPTGLFQQLRKNAEFVTAFADRARKHLFNGGALTPEAATQRYLDLAWQVERAIMGESARWGDYRRDVHPRGTPTPIPLYTRDHWLMEQSRLLNDYFPVRTNNLLNHLRNAGLYPTLAAPDFAQHGGTFDSSFPLTITRPGDVGTIWYTRDGSDPRLPGGAISPNAVAYSGPVLLDKSLMFRARILSGTTWSAMTEAPFIIGPPPDLRVTEVMYNPADPPVNTPFLSQAFEFIELQNLGTTELDLGGMKFTRGITFTFPLGTVLEAGQRIVVAKNIAAFQWRYGTDIPVAGEFGGQLDNAGERITLVSHLGQVIDDFTYNDAWYSITDGDGFSLVAIDPMAPRAVKSTKANWRPSEGYGGNPSQGDGGPNPGAIVINELLSHSDEPQGDWIELHNTTDQAINIGGWGLSDTKSNLMRSIIPAGTIIPAGGYIVLTQAQHFSGWGFSENGEAAYLTSIVNGMPGGYRESFSFAASDNGVTFGRIVNSEGKTHYYPLSYPTPGAANAPPLIGPVVISEIMYHPPTGGHEFVELYNVSATTVSLGGWRFTDGIDFTFGPDAYISAGGYALVVGIEPDAFRTLYGIPASVPIYGPYTGALDNAGENLELSKPNDPNPGEQVYYIVVDRVRYDDDPPWPVEADGSGPSLVRRPLASYGNEVLNWTMGPIGGSPGMAEAVVLADVAHGIHWRLALDASGTKIHVYRIAGESQGTPWLVLPLLTPSIRVDSPASTITIDLANGNPLPAGGIQVDGAGHVLRVIGSVWDDTVVLDASRLLIDGRAITYGGLDGLIIDGGAGTDTLEIIGGVHMLGDSIQVERLVLRNAGTVVQLDGPRNLYSLSISDGTALDIGGHELVVSLFGTPYLGIRDMLQTGRNGGAWDGAGLRSSAAAADERTGLAMLAGPMDTIRIIHTWHGDANGDGQVDGADYFLTDLGFLRGGLGWQAGDYDYNGLIDGDDYFLMDQAFLMQTGILAASAPIAPAAAPAGIGSSDDVIVAESTAPLTPFSTVAIPGWANAPRPEVEVLPLEEDDSILVDEVAVL